LFLSFKQENFNFVLIPNNMKDWNTYSEVLYHKLLNINISV